MTASPTQRPIPTAAARPPTRRPAKLPWRDRAGRLSWLKLLVFVALFLPGLWLAADLLVFPPEARQVNHLVHVDGRWTLRILLIALAVTPVRVIFDWPRVLLVRRMIGVAAAAYVLLHFTLYFADQNFRLLFAAAEIVRRVYLIIGFTALLGLVALAATSTDAAVRRMGKNWKRLHRLVYPIGALAVVHAAMQSKADVFEATVMAGMLSWLLLWRLLPAAWQRRGDALAVLAVVAAVVTAGLEYLWYDLMTRIPAARVLAANFVGTWPPRPAGWILLLGLAIALVVTLRAGLRRLRPVAA
jgi:sulfoxide reductase heme-binding subunit YedZ